MKSAKRMRRLRYCQLCVRRNALGVHPKCRRNARLKVRAEAKPVISAMYSIGVFEYFTRLCAFMILQSEMYAIGAMPTTS